MDTVTVIAEATDGTEIWYSRIAVGAEEWDAFPNIRDWLRQRVADRLKEMIRPGLDISVREVRGPLAPPA